MSRVLKCPLCGQKFATDKPRAKYCDNCRKEGNKLVKEAWRKRTNYEQKQVLARREKRAQDLEIITGITRAMKEAEQRKREKEDQERKKQNRKELLADAKKGDPYANMELSQGFEDPNYWKWFQLEELENIKDSTTIRDCNVNGISVFDEDFIEKVIQSIPEEGRIFSTLIFK